MEYRQLGRSGLTVSAIGLGCNNFGGRIDEERSRSVIDAAIDSGITLFDTADIYGNRGGSETIIGRVLKGRRERVVIASKFGGPMEYAPTMARGSRRYIRYAVEQSLRRLQTDWIDLYQLHFEDPETPMDETLEALTELVHEGTVRYIGSSNLPGWKVVDADMLARQRGLVRFVSAQNEYSLLERGAERELLPACAAHGVGVLPYFPLANGLLTGKYRRGQEAPAGTRLAGRPGALRDDIFDRIEPLEAYARDHGHSLLDLAIAGLLARPMIASVIAGATRPEQIEANVAAVRWEISESEISGLLG